MGKRAKNEGWSERWIKERQEKVKRKERDGWKGDYRGGRKNEHFLEGMKSKR